MTSTLRMRPRERHVFASTTGRVLVWLGIPSTALLALIGPLWALVPVAVLVGFVVGRVRIARERWEVDASAATSEFRFGPGARARVRLAELHGIIASPRGGASSRGIAITRRHERWRLVDRDGITLGTTSTEGFADDDLVEVTRRLGVPIWDAQDLLRRGMLPGGTPWLQRHAVPVVVALLGAGLLLVLTTPWHTWSAVLEG